jgi:hypothetical protein
VTPPLTLDAITRARADLAPIGEAITKADRQLFAFVTERMTAGESWWDAAKRLFAVQQVERFGFDVEVLYLARKAGYRVAELPVRWVNSPETKVRPVRDGGRAIIDLAMIRLYDLQGRYRDL